MSISTVLSICLPRGRRSQLSDSLPVNCLIVKLHVCAKETGGIDSFIAATESADKPHVLFSLSKSFTSTAVGLAVAEGKLSIDDLVIKFFPDETPAEVSTNLKAMRVRDLLTMSTGHQDEVNLKSEVHWKKLFLNHPVPHKPGTHFKYNTPATYMLSAIVQKVTGETVLENLKTRLFDPLGIVQPKWDSSPEGISLGGYGLFVRTEDIAKFGQLYLQKGSWQGKQLVQMEALAMDLAPQESQTMKQNLGIHRDYFVDIPPDGTDEEAEAARLRIVAIGQSILDEPLF